MLFLFIEMLENERGLKIKAPRQTGNLNCACPHMAYGPLSHDATNIINNHYKPISAANYIRQRKRFKVQYCSVGYHLVVIMYACVAT